jgi:hypothetical protein
MNDVPVNIRPVPAGWLESLAISERQVAEGKTVAADIVHRMCEDAIARIDAKRAASHLNRRASG